MFQYKRLIFLRDTDATGVLYFSELLRICQEAFEVYLTKKFTLQAMLKEHNFLLPIVHAEADYSMPLQVGDEIEVNLSLEQVGTSSFTLEAKVLKKGKEAGIAKIVHVATSKESGKSVPIPEELLAHLKRAS